MHFLILYKLQFLHLYLHICCFITVEIIFNFRDLIVQTLISLCISVPSESTPASFRQPHPDHSSTHCDHSSHLSSSLTSSPCHCLLLLLFCTRNSKRTFSRNPHPSDCRFILFFIEFNNLHKTVS